MILVISDQITLVISDQITHVIERFSIECRETKTKEITTANPT